MKKLLLILALTIPVQAAISSTTQWEVRSSGNSANGGCFDPFVGVPGTDYSVQDAAQVTYTDLVIGGTTTQLTSAATPFTSAMVGNCIQISSGTGFTTGFYIVNSVSGVTATLDRSVGTGASTGGNGKLGGGITSLNTAMTNMVSNNTAWIKSGTYTLTTATSPTINFAWRGYASTHGDEGTKPLVTTATNSTNIISYGVDSSPWIYTQNIDFSNTAGTRGKFFDDTNFNGINTFISINCTFTGFSNVVSVGSNNMAIYLINVYILNSTSNAITMASGTQVWLLNTIVKGSGAAAISSTSGGGSVIITIQNSVIAGTTGIGVDISTAGGVRALRVINSTISGNSSDGLKFDAGSANLVYSPGLIVQNSIIYGNGGYGINTGTSSNVAKLVMPVLINNAFGSNTSGNTNGLTTGTNPITLSANPIDSNYMLNNTAGGGALLRTTGFPGTFTGTSSIGYLDVGAVQSQGIVTVNSASATVF